MKSTRYIAALLFGSAISFVLGWQTKSLIVPPSNDKTSLELGASNSNLEQQNIAGSVSVNETPSQEKHIKAEPTFAPAVLPDDDNELEQALAELAQLGQRLEDGELVDDIDGQISRFMSIVIKLGENRFGETQEQYARFATQIIASKELFSAFINHYPKLENVSDQNQFASVFLSPRGVDSSFRENFILDKIKSNEQASVWLKTLSTWGVQEASTVDYLLDQIPYFSNPDDLAAAITASTNAVRPRAASDTEFMPARENAPAIYEPYFEHNEDAVRAAAIGTLRTFPREDMEDLVNQAMTDPASVVRQQAISVIRATQLNSETIQDTLRALIRDQDEALHVRSFAVAALRDTAPEGSISMDIIEIARKIRQQEMAKMRSKP